MSLSGRSLLLIIPAMILSIFLVDTMQVSAEEPTAYGPHWVPLDPQTGEEFEFFIYISEADMSDSEILSLNVNGKDHSLNKFSKVSGEGNNGTLYHSSITLKISGIFTYNVTMEINGTLVNIYRGEIEIFESTSYTRDDTILGLPRWWCVVSVIFVTIFMIFLTWAYFKGRSIKRYGMDHLPTGIKCSSCGAYIGKDDPKCSKCGSILDEVEYICGKCGKNVTHRSITCPHCGSKLKRIGQESNEKNDQDIVKLDGVIDMKEKVNCPYCEGVISSSDKRCPACKRKL